MPFGGGGSNDIDLQFDPKSILEAFRRVDKARQEVEKGIVGAAERMNTAFTSFSEQIIKVSNRSKQAQERYIKSIEQTAAAYGKSGVDKLIAQRDQIIKKLGDEEKLINRVRAAYDRMIEVEKKRGSQNHGLGSGGFALAVRSARDLFEGRTAYAEVMGTRALATLSGLPFILGATAAAFGVVISASGAAAKSIGDYGQKIKDLQLTTGLTAKEVQQFAFAARIQGQDVAVLDRMIRGLTQAIEDEGDKGQKARIVMRGMGVDLVSLQTGTLSSIDLFKQISSALEEQPNLWVRNKEAIDLFKRAGINSLPMLIELNKTLRESGNINFASDSEIRRFEKIHRDLSLAGEVWDQFILRVKSSLATPFVLLLKWSGVGQSGAQTDEGQTRAQRQFGVHWPAGTTRGQMQRSLIDTYMLGAGGDQAATLQARALYEGKLARTDPDAAMREADRLKGIYESVRGNKLSSVAEVQAAYGPYKRQLAFAEGLRKSKSDRQNAAEALIRLQKEAGERASHPYGMSQSQRLLMQYSELPGTTPGQLEQAKQLLLPMRMNELSDTFRQAGLSINPDGTLRRSDLQLGHKAALEGLIPVSPSAISGMHQRLSDSDERSREIIRRGTDILRTNAQMTEESGIAGVRRKYGMMRESPENQVAMAREILNIRKSAADELHQIERSRIADEYGDAMTRELAYTEARMKHAREVGQAEQEYGEAALAAAKERFTEIRSGVESILHTVITNPRGAAKSAFGTIRDLSLRPFESKIADSITRSLGFANKLNDVQLVNGAVPVVVMNGGGGGGVGGGSYGGSIFPGISGMPFMSGGTLAGLMSGTGLAWAGGGGGGVGGGGTYGAGGGYGSGANGGGGGVLGSIFGGGQGRTGGGGGWRSMLGGFGGNLKSMAGFGKVVPRYDASGNYIGDYAINGSAVTSTAGISGKLNTFAHSQLAKAGMFAGGTFLAQRGLLGNDRGTMGGAIQGMLGGALIGAAIGGPLGAGIGAGVGLGIGIGEMIAGVESPRMHAVKLVRQLYGIRINSAVADSIVALAQQSYGNQISVAVRSPEVRQMLGLYAAGTSQNMPMSAMSPHGASFSNIGGSLVQSSVYQYGKGYAYQSNLPIEGGGAGVGSLSNPGGPTLVSLNISGSAVAPFMTGQYVTPDFVQSQYSSAMQGSRGRMDNALTMVQPGAIVA